MKIKFNIIVVIAIIVLTSCSGDEEKAKLIGKSSTTVTIPIDKSSIIPIDVPLSLSNEGKVPVAVNNKQIVKLPDLPNRIKNINEVETKGWSILDSLKNDFNGDGLQDIVGVLDHPIDDMVMYPRLFFVYLNKGNEYSLNIMNPYLIRNRYEGGVLGDPYQNLTTIKNTITTNAYGGSAWRWSENHTFEFKNGKWFLLSIKHIFGYGPFETSYEYNDYKNGIGFRRITEDSPRKTNPKSIEYNVKLEKQPFLEDFAFTNYLSEERIKAPEIKSVGYNAGIKHFEGVYPELSGSNMLARNNEYVIYKINQTEDIAFIGVYSFANKNLQMIARYNVKDKNKAQFSDFGAELYNDRLYYIEDINRFISVREDGNISKQSEVVAVQLISIGLNGCDKKVILKENHPLYKENEIIDNGLDYLTINYEISGNEIIVQIYGSKKQTFYRMNLQGGNKKLIGSIPKGDW